MDTKKESQPEKEIKDVKECCTARDVLWYLVFVGFAVNYMIRINLNIAIVDMVVQPKKDNVSLTSECLLKELHENYTHHNETSQLHTPLNNISMNETIFHSVFHNLSHNSQAKNVSFRDKHNLPFTNVGKGLKDKKKFEWDAKVQGYVLGSFFWLHWTTQVPGGLLASRYGTKLIFGLSNLSGVLFCFCIPFFARLGSNYLMALRLVQGLLLGFAWPSMHDLTARWIPPNERSKFVTAYLGSSVGTAMTYPICGFIIAKWGWEYVFYACSAFGTCWFLAWWILVYDSPNDHPRISHYEKEYIVNSLGQSVAKERAPVPWCHIIRNPTVWMNVLAQWGGLWGLFTLMTHAPTYFKFIHGWDIKATGFFSGMPHLLRMVWAYIFSQIGDYLLRSNKMSRTNVRKLATVICCIGQGLFMMALAYSGCDSMAAIIYLTLAVGIHGSVSTGPLASVVDISPNYASVLLGFMNTAAAIVGFFTPTVVGYLTYQNQTTAQWQKVFWISSTMLFACGILYVIFTKSELQPWNSPETMKKQSAESPDSPETELMLVKSEKNGTNKPTT